MIRRPLPGTIRHAAVLLSLLWCAQSGAEANTAANSAANSAANTTVSAVDDGDHRITLPSPATRIISLAPHITELLYAAGAGSAVVGVSTWSDYPPAAEKLPVVADGARLELERIIDLQPDLVIAWKSGSSARQVARLRKLGLVVFESEPRSFEDIARSLERFGTLAGSPEGKKAAVSFRERLQELRGQYSGRRKISVFYQIWPSPLMTLNGKHMVTDALRLCGATNIFASVQQLAPTVSQEAVVTANPDAIILTDERSTAADRWRRLSSMKAVSHNNLFSVNGTLMNRAGPRILEGTAQLCERIDTARKRLTAD
jgi:iron complex transport system substrate-binding protein